MISADAYLCFGMFKRECMSLSYEAALTIANETVLAHASLRWSWSLIAMYSCLAVCSMKDMVRSSMKAVATISWKKMHWEYKEWSRVSSSNALQIIRITIASTMVRASPYGDPILVGTGR